MTTLKRRTVELPAAKGKSVAKLKAGVRNKQKVSKDVHSYGKLDLPTDKFGLTGGLRKEVQKIAAKVVGAPEKVALVAATMEVLLKYLDARSKEAPASALKRRTDVLAAKAAPTTKEEPEATQEAPKAKDKDKGKK